MTASLDSSTGLPPRLAGARRQLLLLTLFALAAAASWLGLAHLRQRFVFETFAVAGPAPIPVDRVRLRGEASPPVHVVLLPGYIANRRQLLPLAEVLAAAGADVFVVDLPGRGDNAARASPMPPAGPSPRLPTPHEAQATLTVIQSLEAQFGIPIDRLVVIGHSMGGGVALEVGRQLHPLATISLSGLERPIGPADPPNLLLITGRLDFPPLRRTADRMFARAAPGGSAAREEFFSLHSNLPFHDDVQQALVAWINRALPTARLQIPSGFNGTLLLLELATLFFLSALFVPLASLLARALMPHPSEENVSSSPLAAWPLWQLAGYALLAALAAVSTLRLLAWAGWRRPLGFLGLGDGDYLAAVLLLTTLWLLPLLRRRGFEKTRRWALGGVVLAAVLAVYLLVVGGGFLTWQLYDFWPAPARWVRLPLLLALLSPYALGEELLVAGFSRHRRGLGAFLLWRGAVLIAVPYAALALASGAGMLVLMTLPLVLLSLIQYFFSTTLRRTLGSVYAVAAFNEILLAWFFAAVFPLR